MKDDPTCWKRVEGFPDYEINQVGQVRRFKPYRHHPARRLLKGHFDSTGYLRYELSRDGISHQVHAHTLILQTFVGPKPSANHEAAHGDGIRGNSVLSNLRWATRRENSHDRYRHGTMPNGQKSCRSKLTDSQVGEIRRLLETVTNEEISRRFNISRQTVSAIKTGARWKGIGICAS